MPTETRPRNFKQVLAESLAKGLAQYQISRQQKLDDEADLARQQMVMQEQEQAKQMKLEEHKARLREIDMQIRRHQIEMAMTPQQRMELEHKYRMAELDAKAKADIATAQVRADTKNYTQDFLGAVEKDKAYNTQVDRDYADAMDQYHKNLAAWEKRKNEFEIAKTSGTIAKDSQFSQERPILPTKREYRDMVSAVKTYGTAYKIPAPVVGRVAALNAPPLNLNPTVGPIYTGDQGQPKQKRVEDMSEEELRKLAGY